MNLFFIEFIVRPFYNLLVFLVDFLTNDLGLAIIILTIIFRFIVFPISKNQIKTQLKMKDIQAPLKELKIKYKDNPQQMAQEMMKLYKDNNIKPFSGILLLFIQLPLFFGLYYIFNQTNLPNISPELIYPFLPYPTSVDTVFLGLELTTKSFLLASIVAITQFIQTRILFSKNKVNNAEKGSMEDVMNGVQKQMMYIMPVMLFFISYTFGSIVALYLLISNLFSIGQELYLKKTLQK